VVDRAEVLGLALLLKHDMFVREGDLPSIELNGLALR
jgi:hypothetical protein